MSWREMDYSTDMHFQWKIKWQLETLGTLGILTETAPLIHYVFVFVSRPDLPHLIRRLHFMRVASIRPEQQQPVKMRLDLHWLFAASWVEV